jgi:hypothetical protein
MPHPRKELLDDEWLIVRHSGEIPEIALHSAFYYLTEDPEGPRLQLSGEEIRYLQEAAAARYQEIILRDLCYENRELTIYRGVRRAIFNWHRFVAFCKRENSACPNLRRPGMAQCRSLQERMKRDRRATAEALLLLMKMVLQRSGKAAPAIPGSHGIRPSLVVAAPFPVFNCSFHDITLFAHELGIRKEQLPEDIRLVCDG